MKIEDGNLFVGYHELAFSLRTEGFPIYAILSKNVQKIGETTKRPAKYFLPVDTQGIMTEYHSNSGMVYFTVYPVDHGQIGRGIHINEKNNFSLAGISDSLRRVIANWLREQGYPVMRKYNEADIE